jgi:hypothetical protein
MCMTQNPDRKRKPSTFVVRTQARYLRSKIFYIPYGEEKVQ